MGVKILSSCDLDTICSFVKDSFEVVILKLINMF